MAPELPNAVAPVAPLGGEALGKYSPKIKYSPPYYISPIEIGLLWTKIKYLECHSKALDFSLQSGKK